jgi:hypothetical protein
LTQLGNGLCIAADMLICVGDGEQSSFLVRDHRGAE